MTACHLAGVVGLPSVVGRTFGEQTYALLMATNDTNPAKESTLYEKELSLAIGIILLLTSLATMVGNSLLITAIYLDPYKNFRTAPIFFIANLAFADFLTGLLVDPLYAVYDFGVFKGEKYNTVLSVGDYGSYITVNNAIVTIILLSIDRSIAIRKPFFYRRIATPNSVAIIISISWLYSVFFSMFRLMGMPDHVYIMLDTHLHVTFAFIALSCLFAFIYRNLKSEKQNNLRTMASMGGTQDAEIQKRLREIKGDKRLLVTVFIVLIAFFLCFAPYAVFIHLQFYCDKCMASNVYYFLKRTSEPIVYLSSVINPFIYAWRHKNFRKALGWVLKCRGRPTRYGISNAGVITDSVEVIRQ